MKCPRRKRYVKNSEGGWDELFLPCIKEDCAWWNEHNNECCFISTGKVLNAISTYLYEIKEKIPYAGQFTKDTQ